MKNVNLALVLRNPIPERDFGPQDGLQNAPRSAQDGSKRVLESNFFALENRLKFRLVLGSDFGRFGLPECPPLGTLLTTQIDQKINKKLAWSKSRPKIATRPPKTSPEPPQDPPRRHQGPTRAPQDPPRSLPRPPRNPPKEAPRVSR